MTNYSYALYFLNGTHDQPSKYVFHNVQSSSTTNEKKDSILFRISNAAYNCWRSGLEWSQVH